MYSTDAFGFVTNLTTNAGKDGFGIRLLYTGAGTPTSYAGNDGKIYNVVLIGTQYWIAANLAETKYRNGDWITGFDDGTYTPISNANWAALTTEAMCYYSDNEEYGGGQIPISDVFLKLDQSDPQLVTDTTIADGSKFIINVSNFLREVTWANIKALIISATSYLGLNDTSDTTYTAKDLHVPMVNEANEELDLTPTELATFLILEDTPDSYASQALKLVRVNSGEDAVEFVDGGTVYIKNQNASVLYIFHGLFIVAEWVYDTSFKLTKLPVVASL